MTGFFLALVTGIPATDAHGDGLDRRVTS